MKKKIIWIVIILLLILALGAFLKKRRAEKNTENSSKSTSFSTESAASKTLTEDGGNVDWSLKNNIIAFDRLGSDKYFDIWTMNPDGSNQKCLTCESQDLPNHNIGNPAWHPSGEFLVIQVEKASVPKKYASKAAPGAGIQNDLYIISKDGKKVWNLYNVREDLSKDSPGIIHPHFSNDGKKLAWAERIKDNGRAFGEWAIKLADFSMGADGPKLSNLETITPGKIRSFYETHTFSPDDSKLLFTGNQDGGLEIYELDLKIKKAKMLSDGDPKTWDEHATYSPDGKNIVWMSSVGEKFVVKPLYLETEFWIMNSDGSDKKQLTHFNQKGSKDYFKSKDNDIAVAADNSWGPDGKSLVGLVITADPNSEDRDKGRIVMMDLNKPEPQSNSNIKNAKVTVLSNSGSRVFWVESDHLIYYDKRGADGYFDIYTMNEDGFNSKCLTCEKNEIPQFNIGFPQVHPNNKYILFQAENPNLKRQKLPKEIQKFVGNPGLGINNDLWVMDIKAEHFWQMTQVKDLHGTLHPYFSEDGKKVVWAELPEPLSGQVGNWELKVADFEVVNDTPRLTNIKTMAPLGRGLYEPQTFTRDGKQIFVSFAPEGKYYYEMEEYLIDIETQKVTQLTKNNFWDEQAKITKDGKIIYVSSDGNARPDVKNLLGLFKTPPELDYWMMNLDGSNKKRLTFFNNPNSPDYIKSDGGIGVAEFVINDDGSVIIGKMRKDKKDQIVKVEFNK